MLLTLLLFRVTVIVDKNLKVCDYVTTVFTAACVLI